MTQTINIHWFRQDLRIHDNPALVAAIQHGHVLPIYILDDVNAGDFAMGGASRWWLHHSLTALNQSLGGALNIYSGDAHSILQELCDRFAIGEVHWNRCYEPWRIKRDTNIKQTLATRGITVKSHSGSLLHEPWTITKNDGGSYQVFTPYYNKLRSLDEPAEPIAAPDVSKNLIHDPQSQPLDSLALLPTIPWAGGLQQSWQPGESHAQARLQHMIDSQLEDYKIGRDFPSKNSVSRLSPHLHFGEISPRQIWDALDVLVEDDNKEHFQRELCWRDFSYYLLFHIPDLPTENLRPVFDKFPWHNDPDQLKRWQQGKTGFPLVDAGMRELWQTGYMHNRVRMITASLLVKNLQIDWRLGAAWFWDCLVDADLASNTASWQWVAGSGADASPYFRIFNPTTQGEKFDADGSYIKKYLPELKDLPSKYLFKPWEAPPHVLEQANIQIGTTYPAPMIDLKQSRQEALDAYQLIRNIH